MRRRLLAACLLPLGGAFLDGPPPGHTGGFGEPTCAVCHFGDAAPPVASLVGLPAAWAAGEVYPLRVAVAREALGAAGMQLAARGADGVQAGRFSPGSARLAVDQRDGVAYLRHTRAGTAPTGADTSVWAFSWRAPDGVRDTLVFHLAVLGADGDGSPFGDAVATRLVRVPPARR